VGLLLVTTTGRGGSSEEIQRAAEQDCMRRQEKKPIWEDPRYDEHTHLPSFPSFFFVACYLYFIEKIEKKEHGVREGKRGKVLNDKHDAFQLRTIINKEKKKQ